MKIIYISKYLIVGFARKSLNTTKEFLNEILYTCELFYPNLKLAITLQAYGGLRVGEVCNVSFDKIEIGYENMNYIKFAIDLREKSYER